MTNLITKKSWSPYVVRAARSLWQVAWIVLVTLTSAANATACPYCDTEIGKQVRTGIFDEQFWSNVTLTLLPLFVLLGIVALIHFDLSWLWSRKHGEGNSTAPQATQETDE